MPDDNLKKCNKSCEDIFVCRHGVIRGRKHTMVIKTAWKDLKPITTPEELEDHLAKEFAEVPIRKKCLYDFDGYCELTNDSCDECDEYEPVPS